MKNATLLTLLMAVSGLSQPQPKFEIADVHVSKSPQYGYASYRDGVLGVLGNGRYIYRDATMLQLIEAAWGMSEDTISGGPSWVSLDLYDVIAKVPDGTGLATTRLMLQNLLLDRFGLVVGHGTLPLPRYVLTITKGGSKLKPASGSETTGCQPQPPGNFNIADPSSIPNNRIFCRGLTSLEIAENLRMLAGDYVAENLIDSTGLKGAYDFNLEWTSHGVLGVKGADAIPLFTALEKQLGLKLELQNVSVPSLMIEKVNRKPGPNPAGVETSLAEAAPRFEAASIKLANPDKPFKGFGYTGGTQMRAGGTLRDLISYSLGINRNVADDTVMGLPKSADEQQWDIIAKLPETGEGAPSLVNGKRQLPPRSVLTEMLHGFLVDSFEIKTHTENRELTVYALTLVGSKPKMTRANDSERSGCKLDYDAPKPAPNLHIFVMNSCKNLTMEELATYLPQWAPAWIDHPIIDESGLRGGWDFLLGWTPSPVMMQLAPPSAGVGDAASPNGISAFEALEQELKLKLVTRKRMIPVIVVDHIDERPIE